MTLIAALRSLPRSTLVLRALIPVFSLTALLVALPEWPNTWLSGFLVLCSLRWALRPEDVAGVIVLVLVVAWWGIHGADGPDHVTLDHVSVQRHRKLGVQLELVVKLAVQVRDERISQPVPHGRNVT